MADTGAWQHTEIGPVGWLWDGCGMAVGRVGGWVGGWRALRAGDRPR